MIMRMACLQNTRLGLEEVPKIIGAEVNLEELCTEHKLTPRRTVY
jgi:hypothetical protein